MLEDRNHRLLGKVSKVERTGEKRQDEDGTEWEKCIFTVELVGFSKRTPEPIPEEIRGKKVKLCRWCCFDWHYNEGYRTLDVKETKAIMNA